MPKLTSLNIHREIMRANNILLIPHQHPDGDALGSVTALMEWLKNANKKHAAYCGTEMTPRLEYLPHFERIRNESSLWNSPSPDLLVVCDSGDLRYAGVAHLVEAMPNQPMIVNIDHHVTNEHFGDHNLVMPNASSTCEVLHHFFTWNRIPINATMATSLLTGLLTDTDNFTNAATSASSLAVGHDLLRRGGNMRMIQRLVFRDKTMNTLKLWGVAFARLDRHSGLDLVHTFITQEDLRTHNASEKDAEGLANYMNNLKDGRASLIVRELSNGVCKGSFRTTRDDTDVSLWAKMIGGGGHKKAAGFTIPGPVETAMSRIFDIISRQG